VHAELHVVLEGLVLPRRRLVHVEQREQVVAAALPARVPVVMYHNRAPTLSNFKSKKKAGFRPRCRGLRDENERKQVSSSSYMHHAALRGING